MGIPDDIVRLEQSLRELITRYEQYFFGIEKREPLRLLEDVERQAKRYQNVSIANSTLRFKYDSLLATLTQHRQKWRRINRLIEEGKYDRYCFKASPPRGEAAREEPPPATGVFASQVERVYQEYCSARIQLALPPDNVSREKIAAIIEQKTPLIREKYLSTAVEFFVAVEKGRPCLKARPKKC
jgi:hypothetical protein